MADLFEDAATRPQRLTLPQQALAQFLQVLAARVIDPENHDRICDVITELLPDARAAVPAWFRPVLQVAEDVARYRAGRQDKTLGTRDWFAVSAPLSRAMHDFAWQRGSEALAALQKQKENAHAA